MASVKAIRDGLRDLFTGVVLVTEDGDELLLEDGTLLVPEGAGLNLGLNVYDTIPDHVTVPAAIIGMPSRIQYDVAFRNPVARIEIPIRVISGRVLEAEAQDRLDDYVSADGALSLRAAIDADPTLGGVANSTRATEARDYGVYTVGDVPYLGVELICEVIG
jgi:hypothetical protein